MSRLRVTLLILLHLLVGMAVGFGALAVLEHCSR